MSDVLDALEQGDVRQVFESAGDGPWTVLCDFRKEGDLDVLWWSMLAPPSLRRDILADINRLPALTSARRALSRSAMVVTSGRISRDSATTRALSL